MSPAASSVDEHIERRLGQTVSELVEQAEHLRGLAASLDSYAGTNRRAEAEELKHVAVGVRAGALQVLLVAFSAVASSERFAALAGVREATQP